MERLDPLPPSNPVLEELVNTIRAWVDDVQGIYLFGSWKTDVMHQNSDIDLAFLASRPLDSIKRWELAQVLAVTAGCDADLVDLHTASTVIRAQVVAYGTRVYCANESFCGQFEDQVFSEYARLNEERRDILNDIQQRGRIYA